MPDLRIEATGIERFFSTGDDREHTLSIIDVDLDRGLVTSEVILEPMRPEGAVVSLVETHKGELSNEGSNFSFSIKPEKLIQETMESGLAQARSRTVESMRELEALKSRSYVGKKWRLGIVALAVGFGGYAHYSEQNAHDTAISAGVTLSTVGVIVSGLVIHRHYAVAKQQTQVDASVDSQFALVKELLEIKDKGITFLNHDGE